MFCNKLKLIETVNFFNGQKILCAGDFRLLTHTDLEKIDKRIDETNTKLDLILKHLELKYVPETEKKEPAKLEKRDSVVLPFGWGEIFCSAGVSGSTNNVTTSPKKEKVKRKKK